MYNVESTVGSQYANSPQIDALIAFMVEWIDPTVNLQQFYTLVWNISTAVGFGLDIWIAPYLSMGGRVVYRGMALGEPSFSIAGVKARTIVHGLSVDAGATIHF